MSLNIPTIPVTAGTVAPPVTIGTVAPPVSVTAPSVGASLLNTTLLSATLLTFGGQRYAPKTASSFDKEYDYIVVGAGSAGSVVASRLSEVPCVSVLLLEAGDEPPALTEVPAIPFEGTPIDWGYKTEPQKYGGYAMKEQKVGSPCGKVLGGSSILNAMFYIRGNHQNYDDWAAAGCEGWSYNDVLPYFKKSEDNKNQLYVDSGYHGKGGPLTVERPRWKSKLKRPIRRAAKYLKYTFVDSNGARQTGFSNFQATMRRGQRCSTAKAYLVPAENRTNLSILLNAMVRKVIIENKRAVGVKFDHMNKTHFVKARREVILSAGAINTPQLLMLSGIGPKEHLEKYRIPVVEDLPVGDNLQDHCAASLFFEIDNPEVQSVTVKLANPATTAQYVANRSGPLASSQFSVLIAFLRNNETHPVVDFPNYEIYQVEAIVDALLPMMDPVKYAKTFAPYTGKPMLICASQILQPKSRGTIRLQSSNPYTAPLIDLQYYEEDEDVKDVVAGMKKCNELCKSPPLKRFGLVPMKTKMAGCEEYSIDSDDYLECYSRALIFTANHRVGTTKMGNVDDPTTVVDPLLRVKNIDCLRVVDCSVMPIVPSANTNAPVIMVAEKASDIIKSTIDCDC